ncbi:MAG: ribosome assembly cofactor RimP [Sphaerochaetaceae bacterium]|nr:ribosome assembly cofactor RimP [Sphaerochaetaceae bacterium]
MLSNDIRENALFNEIESLISPMNLKVVDVVKNDLPSGCQMTVTIYSEDREVNTDDLAEVYNVIYPRYQLLLGERDLNLEVSSPGLTRNFKDFYEFTLFMGKVCKVYSSTYSSWIEGVINNVDNSSVLLCKAIIQDSGEEFEELKLNFSEIQKAKLSYRWEEENNGQSN